MLIHVPVVPRSSGAEISADIKHRQHKFSCHADYLILQTSNVAG